MDDVKPVKPNEVRNVYETIPGPVIAAFNELIRQKFDGRQAVIKQSEAVSAIVAAMACTKDTVFAKHYLDVEQAFREAGWDVVYDRPGWDETYEAFFRFRK